MTKKEENRIHNVLENTSLKFFDKDMKVSDSFSEIISNINSCSPNTHKLFEIMASSGSYKKGSLLDKINSDSLVLISKLCESCSTNNEAISNIVIRTVFGAVEHMPLRALTYLLPSIKLAESIVKYQKDLGGKKYTSHKLNLSLCLE